jgi:hypothetical protein
MRLEKHRLVLPPLLWEVMLLHLFSPFLLLALHHLDLLLHLLLLVLHLHLTLPPTMMNLVSSLLLKLMKVRKMVLSLLLLVMMPLSPPTSLLSTAMDLQVLLYLSMIREIQAEESLEDKGKIHALHLPASQFRSLLEM